MKWLLFSAAMLFLAACSPQAEKIYTVDEFMADDALLAKIIGECRNNPGELRDTPNCRNAEAADGKLRLERMGKSLGG
ncbi:EexN family lipoprotein (plasmid) [Rhizobium sp. Pop5]|uniref:EexN family lipoprotein n=5 Tax=Rhizobium TaxID=379 RepID=A0A2U3CNW7_9HYPH|nr:MULTISPECIES: EexN family lipoprotein [Rhizobium]KEC69584.1 hypothetical protein RLPCCGM1_p1776 [Rhizobium leguminosarum bv. phaseoli CCGM1]ANL37240.1 hypothetical protein AMC89_PC00158 [Rhizobium phaseoli]ANL43621.1 hypothetical protein AMC88_PC00161 [Rhizobium phaseoli]ANL49880.1 hypothetical protein AMC87_PC00181 [Rhizobium phaseoli]ANL62604.1 hypothetical protein AMC85_PC00158 [Rhizobium phaseoli]